MPVTPRRHRAVDHDGNGTVHRGSDLAEESVKIDQPLLGRIGQRIKKDHPGLTRLSLRENLPHVVAVGKDHVERLQRGQLPGRLEVDVGETRTVSFGFSSSRTAKASTRA